jgi:hypothetical protein
MGSFTSSSRPLPFDKSFPSFLPFAVSRRGGVTANYLPSLPPLTYGPPSHMPPPPPPQVYSSHPNTCSPAQPPPLPLSSTSSLAIKNPILLYSTPPYSTMDFVNKFTGGDKQNQNQGSSNPQQQKQEGGFLSGFGDKLNSAAGGGRESEKNEDMLDKGTSLPYLYSTVLVHVFN